MLRLLPWRWLRWIAVTILLSFSPPSITEANDETELLRARLDLWIAISRHQDRELEIERRRCRRIGWPQSCCRPPYYRPGHFYKPVLMYGSPVLYPPGYFQHRR